MTILLTLTHPIVNVPATAVIISPYMKDERQVGQVLQFADGHTASLTWAEIRQTQREALADRLVVEFFIGCVRGTRPGGE